MFFLLLILVSSSYALDDYKSTLGVNIGNKILGIRNWFFPPETRHVIEHRSPKASCGEFTREVVVDCVDKIADLNCDNKLSASEIVAAKDNHLSFVERTVFWFKTSAELIMTGCDKDKDGFITHDEFLNQYEGCINNAEELCHLRDICYREMQKQHVCGR